MKISDKQIMQLIDIVNTYITISEHLNNKNIATKLLRDIIAQQSDELFDTKVEDKCQHENTEYLTEHGMFEKCIDCNASLHRHFKDECQHESDGDTFLSIPPQYKCIKCGEIYR